MTVSKKKIAFILFTIFLIYLVIYWKDFYEGLVDGMHAYKNQVR